MVTTGSPRGEFSSDAELSSQRESMTNKTNEEKGKFLNIYPYLYGLSHFLNRLTVYESIIDSIFVLHGIKS